MYVRAAKGITFEPVLEVFNGAPSIIKNFSYCHSKCNSFSISSYKSEKWLKKKKKNVNQFDNLFTFQSEAITRLSRSPSA